MGFLAGRRDLVTLTMAVAVEGRCVTLFSLLPTSLFDLVSVLHCGGRASRSGELGTEARRRRAPSSVVLRAWETRLLLSLRRVLGFDVAMWY